MVRFDVALEAEQRVCGDGIGGNDGRDQRESIRRRRYITIGESRPRERRTKQAMSRCGGDVLVGPIDVCREGLDLFTFEDRYPYLGPDEAESAFDRRSR